jgi:hypothetical protein
MLSDKTLVLCHGHKHRKIQQVDYEKAILATIREEDEPDIILDLTKELPESLTQFTFPTVIDAFCPYCIKLIPSTMIYVSNKYGIPPYPADAEFEPTYIAKIKKLLATGGLFYTICPFDNRGRPRNALLRKKLEAYGFKFVRFGNLTFGQIDREFHVYMKL